MAPAQTVVGYAAYVGDVSLVCIREYQGDRWFSSVQGRRLAGKGFADVADAMNEAEAEAARQLRRTLRVLEGP